MTIRRFLILSKRSITRGQAQSRLYKSSVSAKKINKQKPFLDRARLSCLVNTQFKCIHSIPVQCIGCTSCCVVQHDNVYGAKHFSVHPVQHDSLQGVHHDGV